METQDQKPTAQEQGGNGDNFGPFTLLTKLAEGGMAVTWLARVRGDEAGRELVIKRVLPELSRDAEFKALFEEETRIATRLDHPNVVRTFDTGETGGESYIAMEYIWGEDLRRIVERGAAIGKTMPLRLVVDLIARAARGLHHAHNLHDEQARPIGLVHRDISPPNLMVGFDGTVKVVDFGVASAESHFRRVRPGQLQGKFQYMSPEQVQGLEVDHRSDIFSLGILLYELTTRRRLFRADSDVATIKMVSEARFDPPSRVKADYPPRLAEIVERALARNPEDRWSDADAFAEALEAFLAETRQTPTAAQMGAFVRELFPDRLEELESLLGAAYQGPTAPPRLPERPKPAPAPVAAPAQRISTETGPVIAVQHTLRPVEDEDMAQMKSSGGGIVWFVGAAIVLFAAFFGYKVLTGEATAPGLLGDVDAGPDRDGFVAEPLARPEPPPVVTWQIRTTPAEAWVIVNGVATRRQSPDQFPLARELTNSLMIVRDGYETQYLEVDGGAVGSSLDVELAPITQPPDWTPPPPEAGQPPATWSLPMGRIRVVATGPEGDLTGAEVLRNGQLVEGGTPIEFEVPAGQDQHITIRLAGFRDSITVVRAPAWDDESDTRHISLPLTPARGDDDRYTTLRLTTNPADMTVSRNGEPQGRLNSFNLTTPELHVFRFEAPDHEPMVRVIDARPGFIQMQAFLSPIDRGRATLAVTTVPDDVVVFARPDRHGASASARQIGRGTVEAREMDAGPWEITLSRTTPEGRQQARFTIELTADTAHTFTWELTADGHTEVAATSTPIAEGTPPR